MHPVLAPGRRRLWRDSTRLQLGRSGKAAVVLCGLTGQDRGVLQLLDGTRSRAQVLEQVRAQLPDGAPGDRAAAAERAELLLSRLDDAGLLGDAGAEIASLTGVSRPERERRGPDLVALCLTHGPRAAAAMSRRARAAVVVDGAGRVGAALAALLVTAGVGTVDVRDAGAVMPVDTGPGGLRPGEVGRPRELAARDLLHELAPSAALTCRRPDLVVLTGPQDRWPDPGLMAQDGLAHLVARVEDLVGVVGPLVLPGSTACLHCLDLTRSDLDPDWPALAVQLQRAASGPEPCDGVLAAAVAAQAALQVLDLVDGRAPAAVGGTLELATPGWRWRRRSWPVHPDCGCAWDQAA